MYYFVVIMTEVYSLYSTYLITFSYFDKGSILTILEIFHEHEVPEFLYIFHHNCFCLPVQSRVVILLPTVIVVNCISLKI